MQRWEPAVSADLLSDAAAAGLPMTSRALTDWTERGLLAQPQREGLGRGRGVQRIYSAQAREVFNCVLAQRHRTAVAELTRVVVGCWLYWGDDWVPRSQFERAFTGWLIHFRTNPDNRSTRDADQLIARVAHPDATKVARQSLRLALRKAQSTGRLTDPAALTGSLTAVVDPHGDGAVVGTPGLTVTPQDMVAEWVRREAALNQLLRSLGGAQKARTTSARFDARTWGRLHQARTALLGGLGEYDFRQPLYTALPTPDTARWTQPTDATALISDSCSDLLSAYGALLSRDGSS